MTTLIYDALSGLQTPAPVDVPEYTHYQATTATTWTVPHGLGRRPSVTLTDLSGTAFEARVDHTDINNTEITLSEPLAGWAYCI